LGEIKSIDGIGLTQAGLIHDSIHEEKTKKTPTINEEESIEQRSELEEDERREIEDGQESTEGGFEKEVEAEGSVKGPAVASQEEEEDEPVDMEDDEFYECEECGFLTTRDEDKCPYCDAPIDEVGEEDASESVEEKNEREGKKETIECPVCGKENDPSRDMCYACGKNITEI